MTIPEAAWLILDASALGRDGDLFVLDMGEPVRVLDLARDLVRLAGRDPESQPIQVIGLRPGEKLHEELFYDAEDVEPTASAKVLRTNSTPAPASVRDDVRHLLTLATGGGEADLRTALLDYVRAHDAPPQRHVEPAGARPIRNRPIVDPAMSELAGASNAAIR